MSTYLIEKPTVEEVRATVDRLMRSGRVTAMSPPRRCPTGVRVQVWLDGAQPAPEHPPTRVVTGQRPPRLVTPLRAGVAAAALALLGGVGWLVYVVVAGAVRGVTHAAGWVGDNPIWLAAALMAAVLLLAAWASRKSS